MEHTLNSAQAQFSLSIAWSWPGAEDKQRYKRAVRINLKGMQAGAPTHHAGHKKAALKQDLIMPMMLVLKVRSSRSREMSAKSSTSSPCKHRDKLRCIGKDMMLVSTAHSIHGPLQLAATMTGQTRTLLTPVRAEHQAWQHQQKALATAVEGYASLHCATLCQSQRRFLSSSSRQAAGLLSVL